MEMKPIFLAMGPAFKNNFVGKPISCLDIYGLICRLLDIPPSPNNGSLAHVAQFLKEETVVDVFSGAVTARESLFMLIAACSLCLVVVNNLFHTEL